MNGNLIIERIVKMIMELVDPAIGHVYRKESGLDHF